MPESPPSSLLGLNLEELTALVLSAGEPSYRARQLFDAIYRKRVFSAGDITSLPRPFREWLSSHGLAVGLPKIAKTFVSNDGTVRYLIEFADRQTVETVWMPEGDGGEAGDGTEAGDQPK